MEAEARDQTAPTPALPDLERIASLESLRWAWLRVRANKGVAGADGVSLKRFEAMRDHNLLALSDEVMTGNYRPGPVRIVTMRTPGKRRRIALLCVRDRVLQRAVLDHLGPHCERQFLPASYGYRPGRSLEDAVDRIVRLRNRGLTHVIDADIRQCFDRLDHAFLRTAIAETLPGLEPDISGLLDQWIAMAPAPSGRRSKDEHRRGVLQGAPISPLLSNIYLHRLDEALARRRMALVRYADDFIILFSSRERAEQGLEVLFEVVRSLLLELNLEKTRLTTFEIGFDFLGVTFQGDDYSYVVEGKRISIDAFPPDWFHYHPEGYND